jgi:predicted nuclease of predicted toxin-antitoxin system
MRFKLDENLSDTLAESLIANGHDVSSVLAQGLGGRQDEKIFEVCRAEGRALITLDLDFNNPVAFPADGTPGIIILRPRRPLHSLIRLLIAQIPECLDREILTGRLWIVEPGRLRIFDPGR